MKMNYNHKKTFATICLLLVIIVLVPILILAQQNGDDNGNGNGNGSSNRAKGFCNRVSKISSDTGKGFGNNSAKLEQKRERIAERIEERREERDQRYEEKKAKWDANRADHFTKLNERSVTDEQKEVTTDFQEAVVAAIRIRRDAVNVAIQEFRQGLDDVKLARKGSTDEAIIAFKASSEVATEKAQTACKEEGVDPKAVQETLRNELKAAKQEYITARQEVEKVDTDMEALITVKREAIEEAQDIFKESLEKAKADFKANFPDDEELDDNGDNGDNGDGEDNGDNGDNGNNGNGGNGGDNGSGN